jgi:protocadherin Fat 4
LQVTITIKDVNDVSPEFLISNETAVLENTAINTVVTVMKAVDRDEGRNGYLEYSLLDSANGMFTIGSADGLLRVNGKLDRETKTNYTLKVRAKDRGEPSRQTETTLLVRILDENDNTPTFDPKQYSAFIPENASIGVTILQVSW